MTALLEVRDVRVSYGRIEAVKGVSFSVDAGSLVTLIGSNGAGKTTVLRTISGLLCPTAGEVHFDGERIDQLPAHEIVERGIAHAPEGRRIFPRMTVQENLDLGAFTRTDGPAAIAGDLDSVYERFPVLGERRAQAAGTLSGGEQQMLAIGRALMCRPRLLMLDEPSMGLSPIMMRRIFDALARAQGGRHHRPAGGAERVGRPGPGRRGPRAGDGPHRALRHRRRPPGQRPGPQGLPGRGLRASGYGPARGRSPGWP